MVAHMRDLMFWGADSPEQNQHEGMRGEAKREPGLWINMQGVDAMIFVTWCSKPSSVSGERVWAEKGKVKITDVVQKESRAAS